MVQPVASAGASLQVSWFSGQFHGVMKPHTPMASRWMRVVPRCVSKGVVGQDLPGRHEMGQAAANVRRAGEADGGTHLGGHGLSQFFGALHDAGDDAVEDFQALDVGGAGPRGKGGTGCANGQIDIGRGAHAQGGADLFGGGIDDLLLRPARYREPLAIDEELSAVDRHDAVPFGHVGRSIPAFFRSLGYVYAQNRTQGHRQC
jgi:hypothetical protein